MSVLSAIIIFKKKYSSEKKNMCNFQFFRKIQSKMAEFHVERFDPDAVDKTNDENQVDIDYREWWKQIYGMNIITIKSYNFGCRSLYINLSVTQALLLSLQFASIGIPGFLCLQSLNLFVN